MLNKKGDKADMDDDDESYTMTPSMDEKYKKIDAEYVKAMTHGSGSRELVRITLHFFCVLFLNP